MEQVTVINGVLYRIWESANGVNKCHQVIAPRELHKALFSKVHDTRIAAHMGRRENYACVTSFLLLAQDGERCEFLDIVM